MWSKVLSRKQFNELAGRLERGEPYPWIPEPGSIRDPQHDEVCAIWLDDSFSPVEFPHVLVVQRDRIQNFLAWSIPFFGNLRPLTSFVRLLSPDTFRATLAPTGSDREYDFLDLSIGAVIAEVLGEVRSRSAFDRLAVSSFTSTYSFCMARGLRLFGHGPISDMVSTNWFLLRDLTKQQPRRANPGHLKTVWRVIETLSQPDARAPENTSSDAAAVLHSLRAMQHGIPIPATVWDDTLPDVSSQSCADLLQQPKEDRVRVVEAIIATLMRRDSATLLQDFLCGYLVSLVSEGSFEHADLLFPLTNRFPTSLMWYGICLSLYSTKRLDAWKRGLRLRLQRELTRCWDLTQRPTADVALDELTVLSKSQNRASTIPQATTRGLSVELAPGVEQLINWPHRAEDQDRTSPAINESLRRVQQHLALLIGSIESLHGAIKHGSSGSGEMEDEYGRVSESASNKKQRKRHS